MDHFEEIKINILLKNEKKKRRKKGNISIL